MKMVKSLLLGSAAGLVAIAGAQAADLPVKAKPVQYVKICSLYGVGFYYIPGTDMCLKVGGWVRFEAASTPGGNLTWGPFNGVSNAATTSNYAARARGYITADSRNQTAYGTVRSYIAVGLNTNDTGLNTAANQFSANRAFIQWAGFTFGLAQSFYDFYSVPATAFWGNYPASDTGDPGWLVAAYTMQFGNGLSASISAETRRITQIIQTDTVGQLAAGRVQPGNYFDASGYTSGGTAATLSNTLAAVAPAAGAYGGMQAPDIVGNIRLDQAWGSAQVMAAWHQVNSGTYYTNALAPGGPLTARPKYENGFVVGGGIKLNAPMIGKGDYLQAQVNYTEGALRYLFQTPNSNWGAAEGTTLGFGIMSDAVFGGTPFGTAVTGQNSTALQLTTGWGVNAAYEHFWNAQWRTSAYGGYAEVEYNALANAMLCGVIGGGNAAGAATAPNRGSNSVAAAGCNMNWDTWWVGTRTQWNITPDFYMGLDVLYQKLETASLTGNSLVYPLTTGTGATSGMGVGSNSQTSKLGDVDSWSVRFRVHKDFYP